MKPIHGTVFLLFFISVAVAQESTYERCTDKPVYDLLDFWIGEWVVYLNDEKVGDNKIEKILNGCAVMEHWTGAGGNKGNSLFFVDPNGAWKQIWVTEWAANPGGVKEKTHVETLPNSGVRFQGQLEHPTTGSYLDRTTLTPLDDGKVSQRIEISTDDGETWKSSFDAIYVPIDGG